MSPQLLIVLLQDAPFSPGHVPIAPHPMETSVSSCGVRQVWSAPPHRMATFRFILSCALLMALMTPRSAEQTVAGGRVPATFASSHFSSAWVTVRVYFADSEESARLQSVGSACTARGLT